MDLHHEGASLDNFEAQPQPEAVPDEYKDMATAVLEHAPRTPGSTIGLSEIVMIAGLIYKLVLFFHGLNLGSMLKQAQNHPHGLVAQRLHYRIKQQLPDNLNTDDVVRAIVDQAANKM